MSGHQRFANAQSALIPQKGLAFPPALLRRRLCTAHALNLIPAMCELFDCYVAAARRVQVRRGLRPDGIMRETTLHALMCRPTCELSQLKTTRRASRHRPATLATASSLPRFRPPKSRRLRTTRCRYCVGAAGGPDLGSPCQGTLVARCAAGGGNSSSAPSAEAVIPAHPHHILHKSEASTATAWPEGGDVLIRPSLSAPSSRTDRIRTRLAAVEIFCR